MPAALRVSIVLVAWTLSVGCGHGAARGAARPPGDPGGVEVMEEATEPGEAQVASQRIDFAEDDLGAGPTTEIRGAPKRPPLPRFQLFGTRAGDGPQ